MHPKNFVRGGGGNHFFGTMKARGHVGGRSFQGKSNYFYFCYFCVDTKTFSEIPLKVHESLKSLSFGGFYSIIFHNFKGKGG